MNTFLSIDSNIKNYVVSFEKNFDFFNDYSELENKNIVIDENVFTCFKDDMLKYFNRNDIFLFKALEENKTIDAACDIYNWLCKRNAKKNMNLISIGGGITQDVTGFAASTLYRGINWIFIPTTLLAQTDSCIGSKTSINYQKYKNLIGTFYPPSKLHICSAFLKTLKKIDIYSGMGEIIKLQLMKEEYPKDITIIKGIFKKCINDFSYLQDIIYENLNIKLKYMAGDEFDKGRRNLLNYGHCFGHALEVSSNYEIPHGIAVNIGIIFANLISVLRNELLKDLFDKVTKEINLKYIGIELKREYFDFRLLLSAMENDKKREGNDLPIVYPDNNFILCRHSDLKIEEFSLALNQIINILF